MATADELFAANGEDYIVIDSYLRTMTFPASVKNIGVENDKDVHKLNFMMPRYFSEYDLSTFNIRINYLNAQGDGDMYVVTDPTVEDDAIYFSWLVGRHACLYKGAVTFIVCLKLADGEGDVAQEFNTTLASLQVLPGLETEPAILENDYDIIEQLLLTVQDTKRTKIGYNVFPQYRITPTHVIDLPSLDGYYPQGFACDGTYYYVGYLDTATYNNGIIVKYDTAGNEIARSTDTYNHVNSIEIINNKLYVASLGDIYVANMNTLVKESTISCRGGSGFVANVQFSGSYGSVSGNQALQYVMLSSSKGMEVYYNGKKVDCIAVPSSPLTPQGGTGYNGYIYEVESSGPDIGTNGIVNIWDVQGNSCAQISIELSGELEDISIVDNTMYVLTSINSVPKIYSASISMLTPHLPVQNWYNCKGQRYRCDLTYSNDTQLTKIIVPPIVDIFLAYAQPLRFDVITNAFFAKAGYNSSGFEITYFENNVPPASFIRLHYIRTGAQMYEMDSCSIVSLADGSTRSEWNNLFPAINDLFITTEFLSR